MPVYGFQPLDDRLEQSVELGLLAKPQGQLVEQGESLRPVRIGRRSQPEGRGRSVDRLTDVEASVLSIDHGRVVTRPRTIRDRNIHLDRGVADADRLAGLEANLAYPLDRFPVDFRAVGAAEILDPVLAVGDENPRVRPRNPQVGGQIDIDGDPVPRSPEHDRVARLIEDLLSAPVAVAYSHLVP